MRTFRAHRVASLAAVGLAVALVGTTPAAATTNVWIQLNAKGLAKTVVHRSEIPTWFGPVGPNQATGAGGGGTQEQVCWNVRYDVRTPSGGGSIFDLGRRHDLQSSVLQFASVAKAEASWADLARRLRACSGSGTFRDGDELVRYTQSVRTLPPMYGVAGYLVTFYTVSENPRSEAGPGGWVVALRQVGNAVLEVRIGEDLPRSTRTPPTTVPVATTSTVEVLVNRSTYRYRHLAYQSL
ncbi:MAG: sensor domain-containing protein [Candidatus Nanopelagicales bacterium]